ncbi:MAG: hypothetical protein KBS52_07375 [Clostridiales bacterium]|nr:hypothetical protein [Candidatus Equinaster intestinalis]
MISKTVESVLQAEKNADEALKSAEQKANTIIEEAQKAAQELLASKKAQAEEKEKELLLENKKTTDKMFEDRLAKRQADLKAFSLQVEDRKASAVTAAAELFLK